MSEFKEHSLDMYIAHLEYASELGFYLACSESNPNPTAHVAPTIEFLHI